MGFFGKLIGDQKSLDDALADACHGLTTDLNEAKRLLNRGADPKWGEDAGVGLINTAADGLAHAPHWTTSQTTRYLEEIVKLLVEHGANVDARSHSGKTPLMSASRGASVNTVNFLLLRGADPNAADKDGNTPLLYATMAQRDIPNIVTVISGLISKGADISKRNNDGMSPLFVALSPMPVEGLSYVRSPEERIQLIEVLLNNGGDPNERNAERLPALVYAVKVNPCDNNPKVEKFLIEKGAEINGCEKSGITPLLMASVLQIPGTVELLLAQGADPNIKNQDGESPILWCFKSAAQYPAKFSHLAEKIIRMLMDYGADASVQDRAGFSPIMLASQANLAHLIPLLEKHGGIDPWVRYDDNVLAGVIQSFGTRLSSFGLDLAWVLRLASKGGKMDAAYALLATSMLGSMAHIDGPATPYETNCFDAFMNTLQANKLMTKMLIANFSWFGRSHYQQIVDVFALDLNFLIDLFGCEDVVTLSISMLVRDMACADGMPNASELTLLELLAATLSVDPSQSESWYSDQDRRSGEQNTLEKFYSILKCTEEDSDDQVARQYKKLAKDYHPDVIQGKGLPEDFIKFANIKFQEIQDAFQNVMEDRKRKPRPPRTETTETFKSPPEGGKARSDGQSSGVPVTPGGPLAAKVQSLLAEADQAERDEHWLRAVECYEDILDLCPEYSDIQRLLNRAKRKTQANGTHAEKQPIAFACENCQFTGSIDRSKLPQGAAKVRVTCPRCREKTVIRVQE